LQHAAAYALAPHDPSPSLGLLLPFPSTQLVRTYVTKIENPDVSEKGKRKETPMEKPNVLVLPHNSTVKL